MTQAARIPLGKILAEHAQLEPHALEDALREQRRSGSRLGDVLLAGKRISPRALHLAVGAQAGLPVANLVESPVDASLLRHDLLADYLRLRVIPWKREGGAVVLATCEPESEVRVWAATYYGASSQLVVTSPYDLRHAIQQHFRERMTEDSLNRLYEINPQQSARVTFEPAQQFGFAFIAASLIVAFAIQAHTSLVAALVALQCIYAATMLFKWLVFRIGLLHPPARNALAKLPLPDDASLPIYTLLVPLYKEAAMLPRLMACLARMNYPASKLDIKLVLEEDDVETVAAARALKPSWNVDIICVPASEPRTKPKALNYALRFARGEFVTIYDAEDAPEPDQLKKAVRAFRALPPEVACLQSRLNYYNAGETLLSRWFALEYAILFDALLPGLQRLNIPIPLGGTSNHLALYQLRKLGEWDPYNVTEDADLGVRLAAHGLKTVMVDSVTLEEAPVRVRPWLRQRSRWIKGYMQTWLVHMRDPIGLLRQIGPRGFLGFQFFIGLACVSYLSAPLVLGVSMLGWTGSAAMQSLMFPEWLTPFAVATLTLHFLAHWVQAARVAPTLPGYAEAVWKMRLAVLSFPLYWLLHSVASYKALWQLIFRPHFWEKTTHGITRLAHSSPLRGED